ncbi:uncharacterized protein RCO7_11340 [Rhynchosporium graminicola]|uniref:Uncharacterized protein n=1 Tax=Rhynchosporium graminicola TaxID=2792576 RepID=A0A1E1KY48_9HELO|nr:uncharacterized protein RCO7_11340 [Rhynchosporium commune]
MSPIQDHRYQSTDPENGSYVLVLNEDAVRDLADLKVLGELVRPIFLNCLMKNYFVDKGIILRGGEAGALPLNRHKLDEKRHETQRTLVSYVQGYISILAYL